MHSTYFCISAEDYWSDESSIGGHGHADVDVVVLPYEGLHPAGVGLGDLTQRQGGCLDDKVVGGDLQLTLVHLVDLLAESDNKTQQEVARHFPSQTVQQETFKMAVEPLLSHEVSLLQR